MNAFRQVSRSTASHVARTARQEAQDLTRVHIQLRGLPRSALPSDIRRTVIREKLTAVTDIVLDYHRFNPTGRAYLTVSHPDFVKTNLHALNNAIVGGIPFESYSAPPPVSGPPERTRGLKGRADAADRGLITGNGPRGGLLKPGKNVVIWGFPGRMTPDMVKSFLTGYKLSAEGSKQEVLQVGIPPGGFSLYTRYLVSMSSVAEAHRLVRRLHMTFYEPESWGEKYEIRARVIY